jgi:hypothetical protein
LLLAQPSEHEEAARNAARMTNVARKQCAYAVTQSALAKTMRSTNGERQARMRSMQARMATQADQLRRPSP